MSIDILFVAWNRRAFTEASFEALLNYTDWTQVDTLHIHDDGSTDGTDRYLETAAKRVPGPVTVQYESIPYRSPVAAMNRYLDLNPERPDVNAFVKIDNDFVVCPGWLPDTIHVSYLNPALDILGIAPMYGPPTRPPYLSREIEPASHIGGIGLIRHRVFEHCRPVPAGRYGWGNHQMTHPDFTRAWMKPDMPCFELDRLPVEPYVSLAAGYVANGWARAWSPYRHEDHRYWEWWLKTQPVPA